MPGKAPICLYELKGFRENRAYSLPATRPRGGSSMLRKMRLYFKILNGFPISAESRLSPGSFVCVYFFQQEICNRGSRCNVVIIKILLGGKKRVNFQCRAPLSLPGLPFQLTPSPFSKVLCFRPSQSVSQLCIEKKVAG